MDCDFRKLVDENRVEEVKALLDKGFNTYQGLDYPYDRYLMVAVKKGFLAMARLLVTAKGCELGTHSVKSEGYNALGYAVYMQNLEMTKMLLEHDAYRYEWNEQTHILKHVIDVCNPEIAIEVLKYASQREIYKYFNSNIFRRYVICLNYNMVYVMLAITRIGPRYYDYEHLRMVTRTQPRMTKLLDIACGTRVTTISLYDIAEHHLRVGKIARAIGMAEKRKVLK